MSTPLDTAVKRKKYVKWAGLLFIAILFFSFLAGAVHTSFGAVKIWDVSYITPEGGYQRALLYIPNTATAANPAPAVVACHGHNNTAEVQDINSIELSRRGYVVLAIDAYRHGLSGVADPELGDALGGGVYSGIQYLGTLPYVDSSKIGTTGHSMGGGNSQSGALNAYQRHETDPSIIVPAAVIPTASTFRIDADTNKWELEQYGVNGGMVYGGFEEGATARGFKGFDIAGQEGTITTMGGFVAEVGKWYRVGDSTPLTREQAVAAAADGELRVVYVAPTTHPGIHFSGAAIRDITDYFDITLRGGQATIAPTDQIWMMKHIFSGIAMLAFIFLCIPLGGLLLQTPFFGTIIRPEPETYVVLDDKKSKQRFALLFILGMIPMFFLFYILMGEGDKLNSNFLPMARVNGIVLVNLVTAAITGGLFYLYYRTMYKKNGASIENMGIKLPGRQIWKALLMAFMLFCAAYLMLALVDHFFKVDFRTYVFSFRTMTPMKWGMWLKYMPQYLIYFFVTGLNLNMSTRIKGKSEVFNTIWCMVASVLTLLLLCAVTYGSLYLTGWKVFATYAGYNTFLPAILMWGILFIVPAATAIGRFFFKKTGTVWLGAFVNTMLVCLFAVSNTIVTVGPLY